MVIPAIILDNSPRDLIIGLPHIRQYEILKKFEEYFSKGANDMEEEYRRIFPTINYISLDVHYCYRAREMSMCPETALLHHLSTGDPPSDASNTGDTLSDAKKHHIYDP
jgi:hypothetical protein